MFVDFNQNAKDRIGVLGPAPAHARVSMPPAWDAVRTIRPDQFTVRTVPGRFADLGDPHAGIDDAVDSLDGLLALAKEKCGRSVIPTDPPTGH